MVINEFRVRGVIERIEKNNRTMWLRHTKRVLFCVRVSSGLKIENYCIREKVEVSGRITTYILCAVELLVTKIEKIGGQDYGYEAY